MTVTSYRARRRLTIGDGFREPGEPAPEAITWFRLDSYLHTGYIVEAKIEDDELIAWVTQFCPELAQQVFDLSGLPYDVDLQGPHKTPRRRTRTRVQHPVAEPTVEPEVVDEVEPESSE